MAGEEGSRSLPPSVYCRPFPLLSFLRREAAAVFAFEQAACHAQEAEGFDLDACLYAALARRALSMRRFRSVNACIFAGFASMVAAFVFVQVGGGRPRPGGDAESILS